MKTIHILLDWVDADGGTINFTYNQNSGWSVTIACFSTYSQVNGSLLLVSTKDYLELNTAIEAAIHQIVNNGGIIH